LLLVFHDPYIDRSDQATFCLLKSIFSKAWLIVFVSYLFNTTFLETIIYGLPASCGLGLAAYYLWNTLGYQCIYFYLVCKYVNLKLDSLNECIINMKRTKRYSRIRNILQSFDDIYREVNEYNCTYFSKFLFMIWAILGTAIIIFLYVEIFVPLDVVLRSIIVFPLAFYWSIFLFTLVTAASVIYHVNKSYKLLNSLVSNYVFYQKHKRSYKTVSICKVILVLSAVASLSCL
jgi:hypothetical protein